MPFQDNHMDELFRRAAENYPLKEADSQWDAINSRLAAKDEGKKSGLLPRKITTAGKFNWLPVIAITLLIMITPLWIAYYQVYSVKNNSIMTEKPASLQTDVQSSKITDAPSNGLSYASSIKATGSNNSLTPANVHQTVYAKNRLNKQEQKVETAQSGNRIESNSTDIALNTTMAKTEWKNEETESIKKLNTSDQIAQLFVDGINESNTKPVPSASLDSGFVQTALEEKISSSIKSKPRQKGLYGGIAIGLEYNRVKNQTLSKPGVIFGVLAGYRFNRTVSLETGLRVSKKLYYSNGKYFNVNTTDNAMPAGMEVISLDGNSTVLEIPVRLKYNFNQRRGNNYFATAGISSYIVTREVNEYLTFQNGTQGKMTAAYEDAHRYFAASLDLSGGYEWRFHKKQSLRIEPFIQIALKGIGVGNMPVSGGGLTLGYSLFR